MNASIEFMKDENKKPYMKETMAILERLKKARPMDDDNKIMRLLWLESLLCDTKMLTTIGFDEFRREMESIIFFMASFDQANGDISTLENDYKVDKQYFLRNEWETGSGQCLNPSIKHKILSSLFYMKPKKKRPIDSFDDGEKVLMERIIVALDNKNEEINMFNHAEDLKSAKILLKLKTNRVKRAMFELHQTKGDIGIAVELAMALSEIVALKYGSHDDSIKKINRNVLFRIEENLLSIN